MQDIFDIAHLFPKDPPGFLRHSAKDHEELKTRSITGERDACRKGRCVLGGDIVLRRRGRGGEEGPRGGAEGEGRGAVEGHLVGSHLIS